MRERIEDLCGQLEIISGKTGTLIRATVLATSPGSDENY
jgi:signal transduction histidine kinase